MACHDIIAIGASAGGLEALSQLVNQLPPDLAASLFVVQHTSPESPGFLATILDGRGPLPAIMPADGTRIEKGMIYVAPPDRHLLLKKGHMHLTRGPHENRSRPAIDVLFRSAAVTYGPRVIGLILSGFLSDGVVGLMAIKRCGGVIIVQDPTDAKYPALPQNALQAMQADYVLPVAEIGAVITRLAGEPALERVSVPGDILAEARFAERNSGPAVGAPPLGELTSLSCPLCHGPLQFLQNDNTPHYRCHTGHSFTPESLESSQEEAVERALWSALRLMEERVVLLSNMADYELERGRSLAARRFQERAEEMKTHLRYLRELIEKVIAMI